MMKQKPLNCVIKTSDPDYDVVQVKYLLPALEGLRSDIRKIFIDTKDYSDLSVNQFYELIDKWFPVFEVKDAVTKNPKSKLNK